jgi:dihydroflavonol-4-reductase
MGDCDALFHVAADYRLWTADPGQLYRTNVEGTRNVLNAALRVGMPRIVYTAASQPWACPRTARPGRRTHRWALPT